MAVDIVMPKFTMTQDSAAVVRWLRQPGESVEQGEPLLEVETDKVIMEVEAPASGVLGPVAVGAGQTVPVAALIGSILQPGDPQGAEGQGERGKRECGEAVLSERMGVGMHLTPDLSPQRKGDAAPPAQRPLPEGEGAAMRATPAARRLARERGIDLRPLRGSGPRGRIQAVDVPLSAPLQPAPAGALLSLEAAVPRGAAERVLAVANVPLVALLAKTCAWALARQAEQDRWREDSPALADDTVAVVLANGLPAAVAGADRLGLAEIMQRLSGGRERDDRVGSLLIYDLGSLGAERGSGPLVPPAVAALSVGRGAAWELRLLVDLRAISAAAAGRLLADVRAALACPDLLLG